RRRQAARIRRNIVTHQLDRSGRTTPVTGARTTRGTDEAAERIDRRRLLTRGATAAGVAWVAPVVASSPAAAGPGTPLPALPLAAIGDAAGNSWTSSDNGATWTLSTTPVNGQSF